MGLIQKHFKTNSRIPLIDRYCREGKGLDLGSYQNKYTYDNVLGVDIKKNENVDIIWDLNEPFNFVPKRSQDFIFAGEIIEHLLNMGFFIDECHKVLKKGGYLIVTTPNARSLIPCHSPLHYATMMIENLEKHMERHFSIIESGFINVFKRNLPLRLICWSRPNWRWYIYAVGMNR